MLLWHCNELEKSIGSVCETIARDGCDHVGGGYACLLLDPAQNVENYKEYESNSFFHCLFTPAHIDVELKALGAIIIIPRTCARDKAISLSVVCLSVCHHIKITRSPHLGI